MPLGRLHDGIVLLDKNWRIRYLNPYASDLFLRNRIGRSPCKLTGLSLWDFLWDIGPPMWSKLPMGRVIVP